MWVPEAAPLTVEEPVEAFAMEDAEVVSVADSVGDAAEGEAGDEAEEVPADGEDE